MDSKDVERYDMDDRGKDGLHTHVSHAYEETSFDVAGMPPARRLDDTELINRVQRYLETLPVVAFGITIVGTWEATANGIQSGFLNGGPSSIVWEFVLAGAVSGALLPFFTGSQILGVVTLSHPDYVYQGWHATLIVYATILIPLVANFYTRKLLKPIEVFGAVWHFGTLVTFVVVLIALSGRNSASFVFTGNSGNISGWENGFVQWCLGMLTTVFPLTAFDGVLHLSDEVKDPEIRVPQGMVYSYLVGWVVAFAFAIILLFFMGDPKVAMTTPAGWPIMEILN
ncbi:hypothetical protein LTR08_007166 [Meristemomyces frigidus]|nr:hypothetical protein LTR08_007166 [Meristemomyces frigidus]